MSKLRIGWIGCGTHANEMLLPQLIRFDAAIAALCDVDSARLNATGDRFGIAPANRLGDWRALLAHDNTLKDDDALRALFAGQGIDLRAPIVTTCGSGISAAIVMLALVKIGARDVALYDGSWAEWGSRAGAPVACIAG